MVKIEAVLFTPHARQRMLARGILLSEVMHLLNMGIMIEDYPDDYPYPSKLLCGWKNERPLHIVYAYNGTDKKYIIITAYEPDPKLWFAPDFTRRCQ